MVRKIENRTEIANELQHIVGGNIRIRLALIGATQSEFVAGTGIKRSALSQKLSGNMSWTIDDIANAANFFGVSFSEIVSDNILKKLEPKKVGATVARTLVYSGDSLSAPPGTRTLNPRLKRTLL